jgi:hypothetical protein
MQKRKRNRVAGCVLWVHLPVSTLGRTDALDDAIESKATIFSLLSSESVLCMGENAIRNP